MKRSTTALPIQHKIGIKVKMLRSQHNMKQDTLAKAIGLSRNALSNIENDTCEVSLHKCFVIAQAFKLDLIEFLEITPPLKCNFLKNHIEH